MDTDLNKHGFFAIVPAAGIGQRMQSEQPKQYLPLNGKTVLEHTIEKLLAEKKLQRIVVTVNSHDKAWQALAILKNHQIDVIDGGGSRSLSVFNAMQHLSVYCRECDWVLVHDAARPCIALDDLQLLMGCLCNDPVGGILAVPVTDTIKKVDHRLNIIKTVDRDELWFAQTPQMFRYKLLMDALRHAFAHNMSITDEASAIELLGHIPKIVKGRRTNIKITEPEDLQLAEFYLQHSNE